MLPVDYYKNVRFEIGEYIHSSPLLCEFGCGNGATLHWALECHGVKEVIGFDIIENDSASFNYNRVDLNSFASEKSTVPSAGHYLYLDVLEHLMDPFLFLKYVVAQSPVGSVHIMSLPNVINYRVIIPMLLRGRFEYSDAGILDRTHLHFFDKARCRKLAEESGLAVEIIFPARLDVSTNSGKLNKLTLGLFERYLAFQYVIVGVKK